MFTNIKVPISINSFTSKKSSREYRSGFLIVNLLGAINLFHSLPFSNYNGGNYGNGGNNMRNNRFEGNEMDPANYHILTTFEEGEDEQYEKDNEDDDFNGFDASEFYVADICSQTLPIGQGIPTLDDLKARINTQVGFPGNRRELDEDLIRLAEDMHLIFQKVDADTKRIKVDGKNNAVEIILKFVTQEFPQMESFLVEGSSVLPQTFVDKILFDHKKRGNGKLDACTIASIKSNIDKFYQERGLTWSYITEINGMESGNVVAKVNEVKVRSVKVVPIDDVGNPTCKGELNLNNIEKDVRSIIKEGDVLNNNDISKAVNNVFGTHLFERVSVSFRPCDERSQLFDVEVLVRERAAETAEVEAEWKLDRGTKGYPVLARLVPGGSLMFDHRNLGGRGSQLSARIDTDNFLKALDDLSFRVVLEQPYFFGTDDPLKTSLSLTAANTRKLSSVFMSKPGIEIPPVYVDRSGLKTSLNTCYNCNSKGSISFIIESVSCLDESGSVCTNGKSSINNARLAKGPQTTISDSGSDMIISIQSDIVRDTTYSEKNVTLGSRDIFVVDQGIGYSFFNRATASMTRFIPITKQMVGSNRPVSLVVHGKIGNCIGDLASFEYFTLGGPFSCRGYKTGELGSARRFFETAVEARCPLPSLDGLAYTFFEHTNSMGSSSQLRGDPNGFYGLCGSGTSWGYGIKMGALRLEYARDCNMGKGAFVVRFGDRF
jgi:outer membrane protein assembly factor BamA